MAAPKRKHVEPTEESVPAKTATIEDDVNLASFVQWCDDENFQLKSKVGRIYAKVSQTMYLFLPAESRDRN